MERQADRMVSGGSQAGERDGPGWRSRTCGFRSVRRRAGGVVWVGDPELVDCVKLVRSARLRDAVTVAFGEKYPTKGSRKWVEGFAEPERVANTIEFIPG